MESRGRSGTVSVKFQRSRGLTAIELAGGAATDDDQMRPTVVDDVAAGPPAGAAACMTALCVQIDRWIGKPTTIADGNYNRWLVPPAAVAVQMCVGMAYGLSVFWNPLKSALKDSRGVVLESCAGNATAIGSCHAFTWALLRPMKTFIDHSVHLCELASCG
jgi:hypothetical protein